MKFLLSKYAICAYIGTGLLWLGYYLGVENKYEAMQMLTNTILACNIK